jgi:hypothetical protein
MSGDPDVIRSKSSWIDESGEQAIGKKTISEKNPIAQTKGPAHEERLAWQ